MDGDERTFEGADDNWIGDDQQRSNAMIGLNDGRLNNRLARERILACGSGGSGGGREDWKMIGRRRTNKRRWFWIYIT
jgi:hypothetical protein